MTRIAKLAFLAAALPLAACSSLGSGEYGLSDYGLVRVHPRLGRRRRPLGRAAAAVEPASPILFSDVRDVEDWTLNGPLLDGISFVSGLKSGRELIRQQRTADQQVPRFRGDMTPPEIAAMLESLYRVKGGAVDFRTLSLQPRPFLGANGFQFDYEHLDNDELWRRGPRGRRGDRRQALPDPARCRAVALLQCDAARLRSDRRFGAAARG